MARFSENRRGTLMLALNDYSAVVPLPGVGTGTRRKSLVAQMVESIRRIEFVKRIAVRPIDPHRSDPGSALFDPLRAALLHFRDHELDEAIWLVFLATHFGRHLRDGWRLTRDVYAGGGTRWTFTRVANNPAAFEAWLANAYESLKGDGIDRRFGNHRKYETLRVGAARGTANVIKSYIAWVGANRGHAALLAEAQANAGDDPKALFDELYRSMQAVISFGRTARFDYLTMIGKLGLARSNLASLTWWVRRGHLRARVYCSQTMQRLHCVQMHSITWWNDWALILVWECRPWRTPCAIGRRVRRVRRIPRMISPRRSEPSGNSIYRAETRRHAGVAPRLCPERRPRPARNA